MYQQLDSQLDLHLDEIYCTSYEDLDENYARHDASTRYETLAYKHYA